MQQVRFHEATSQRVRRQVTNLIAAHDEREQLENLETFRRLARSERCGLRFDGWLLYGWLLFDGYLRSIIRVGRSWRCWLATFPRCGRPASFRP